MYCPKCGAINNEDAKFCRLCGANLSLVPQALTGELLHGRRRRRNRFEHGGPPSKSNGISKAFVGIAFLLISLFLCLGKNYWAIWMLIPAFALIGKGVAEIVAAQDAQSNALPRQAPPRPTTGELKAQTPPELMPPPASVTESTTKLFDEADHKH